MQLQPTHSTSVANNVNVHVNKPSTVFDRFWRYDITSPQKSAIQLLGKINLAHPWRETAKGRPLIYFRKYISQIQYHGFLWTNNLPMNLKKKRILLPCPLEIGINSGVFFFVWLFYAGVSEDANKASKLEFRRMNNESSVVIQKIGELRSYLQGPYAPGQPVSPSLSSSQRPFFRRANSRCHILSSFRSRIVSTRVRRFSLLRY